MLAGKHYSRRIRQDLDVTNSSYVLNQTVDTLRKNKGQHHEPLWSMPVCEAGQTFLSQFIHLFLHIVRHQLQLGGGVLGVVQNPEASPSLERACDS